MATLEDYQRHFVELRTVMYEYGIVPTDTYNIDKTGFRISVRGS